MKLVCVLTSVHPANDARIFHKECQSLVKAGYKVVLVAPYDKNETIDGINIVGIPRPKGRLTRMFITTLQVYKKALQIDADIYHIHDPELLPIGFLLQKKNKKVIYDVHEDVPLDILDKTWLPHFIRPVLSYFIEIMEAYFAKQFSAIITVTDEINERLKKVNSNCVTIHNYPILDEFSMEDNPKCNNPGIIVNFGGINPARAIIPAVMAIGLLSKEINVKLVLGGKCTSNKLVKQLSTLPTWKYVDYKGVLSRQEMLSYIKQALCALVLYSPLKNHITAEPTKLFETLAAGVPVIVPNFPKWKKFIKENGCGIAVNPEDPKAIAEAMMFFISNPDKAANMGNKGRKIILQTLNWQNEEKKLLQLYEDILR